MVYMSPDSLCTMITVDRKELLSLAKEAIRKIDRLRESEINSHILSVKEKVSRFTWWDKVFYRENIDLYTEYLINDIHERRRMQYENIVTTLSSSMTIGSNVQVSSELCAAMVQIAK